MNLNELTLDNIGSWPTAARALVLGVISIVIFALFFTFDVRPMRAKIAQARTTEADLKSSFQVKYSQVANMNDYKEQVKQLSQMIQGMLAQLPETLDTPDVIGDIAKVGNQANLQFNYIKPLSPVKHPYYTELPIEISVTGNYQQLAQFILNMSAMQRIVTLSDFTITRLEAPTVSNAPAVNAHARTQAELVMQITAHTYMQSNKKKNTNNGAAKDA